MVWLLAVAGVILTGMLAPAGHALAGIGITLAGCTIVTLSLQISSGQKDGYVNRVTSSIAGTVIVLGLATGIFALLGVA